MTFLERRIRCLRKGLNVNLNDESEVNLSSNITMSISAGKIRLDGEKVTITDRIKVKYDEKSYRSIIKRKIYD